MRLRTHHKPDGAAKHTASLRKTASAYPDQEASESRLQHPQSRRQRGRYAFMNFTGKVRRHFGNGHIRRFAGLLYNFGQDLFHDR